MHKKWFVLARMVSCLVWPDERLTKSAVLRRKHACACPVCTGGGQLQTIMFTHIHIYIEDVRACVCLSVEGRQHSSVMGVAQRSPKSWGNSDGVTLAPCAGGFPVGNVCLSVVVLLGCLRRCSGELSQLI
jgi:hypothetical protein